MSNSDSFIDEVTEEVRREKLYGYMRRYGWIAVLAVVLLVGGAAWTEYRNAQDRAAAEATGDALIDALSAEDAAARAEAVAAINAEGDTAAVTGLLAAAAQQEAGDLDAAAVTLRDLAGNGEVPALYRDLAAFKAALLPVGEAAERISNLEVLSQPGQPYRLLALEQIALLQLEQGETDAALDTLGRIEEDAALTEGLQQRVQTLMVALGEPLPDSVTE